MLIDSGRFLHSVGCGGTSDLDAPGKGRNFGWRTSLPAMGRRKARRLQPWQKRRRKTLAMIALVAVVVGPVLVWRTLLSKNVEARLQALRDAGMPTTGEALDLWRYAAPGEDNAADLYIEAYGAYRFRLTTPMEMDALPLFGWELDPLEALSDETLEAMSKFLELNTEALAKLHEAAAIDECWYPRDFQDSSLSTSWGYLSRLRELNKLLCLEAIAAVERQDTARAEEALLAAIAVAGSARNEPVLNAHMIRYSCLEDILSTLLRALAQSEFEERALERLASALAAHEDAESIRNALIGERCIMIVQFHQWFSGQNRDPIYRLIAAVGISDMVTLLQLDTYEEVLAAAELPRHEGLEFLDEIQAEVESGWIFKRIPYFSVSHSLPSIAANEAVVRIGGALLAIERYRLAQGHLPDGLADLVPGFLESEDAYRDPFDGQALRYEALEPGYRVYSVGRNRVDDDGHQKNDIGLQAGR